MPHISRNTRSAPRTSSRKSWTRATREGGVELDVERTLRRQYTHDRCWLGFFQRSAQAVFASPENGGWWLPDAGEASPRGAARRLGSLLTGAPSSARLAFSPAAARRPVSLPGMVLFVSYAGVLGGAERLLLDFSAGLDTTRVLACPEGPL